MPPSTTVTIKKPARKFHWAYGVTTIPERRDTLLPRTLISLRLAGFSFPRLFIDGARNAGRWEDLFSIESTCHYPNVKTVGNWLLGAYELYFRCPSAHRFILFQDDLVTYDNLRQYLEQVPYPSKGYCNLYTYPENTAIIPKQNNGQQRIGWHRSNQRGKGAVALMFDRQSFLTLLSSRSILDRMRERVHGWQNLDGAIVTALQREGISEYVHFPSLVQHTGVTSSMGSSLLPQSDCFMGERFDALTLLSTSSKE